jgi:hypothetical protein
VERWSTVLARGGYADAGTVDDSTPPLSGTGYGPGEEPMAPADAPSPLIEGVKYRSSTHRRLLLS